MNNLIHTLSYLVVIRIIVLVMLGFNVRNEDRLPIKGPAVIVLNHRSHWDSLVLPKHYGHRAAKANINTDQPQTRYSPVLKPLVFPPLFEMFELTKKPDKTTVLAGLLVSRVNQIGLI